MRRNAFGGRFQTVEEMDEILIDQWNVTVSPNDTVYHLGDLAFKMHSIEDILPYLNGSIILIVGNHDPFFKRLHCSVPRMHREAREEALQAGFARLHIEHFMTFAGIGLVQLSHFPYKPPKEHLITISDIWSFARSPAKKQPCCTGTSSRNGFIKRIRDCRR